MFHATCSWSSSAAVAMRPCATALSVIESPNTAARCGVAGDTSVVVELGGVGTGSARAGVRNPEKASQAPPANPATPTSRRRFSFACMALTSRRRSNL